MSQPLRLEYVEADSLSAHPGNWRRHPAEQRAAFGQAFEQVGWVKPIIFNEETNRLVDGHMRRELFAGQIVPVIIGRWSESQERTILATLDPMSLMAESDKTAFAQLLEQLDATGPDLLGLIGATAEIAGLYKGLDANDQDIGEKLPDEHEGEPHPVPGLDDPVPASRSDVPDAVFPSSNEWGIPDLLIGKSADAYDFPVTTWGSVAANRPMPGTWCFYIDDDRFEPLWRDPSRVLLGNPVNAIEPNFSTHQQHPRAFILWQVYRKRWLARWWQSKGLRIFVDLNVCKAARELNLLGVPKGWKAWANRAHNSGEGLAEEFDLACEHAGTGEILYLVYGGGAAVRELCAARGWKWVEEQYDAAKRRVKAKKGAAK
jgi:hypothetical protein